MTDGQTYRLIEIEAVSVPFIRPPVTQETAPFNGSFHKKQIRQADQKNASYVCTPSDLFEGISCFFG